MSNFRRGLPGLAEEFERNRALTAFATMVQADLRLHAGQSGAALIDLDGRLVALVTDRARPLARDDMGPYALPIDSGIRRVIDVLKRGEEVEYGFLGVQSRLGAFGRRRGEVVLSRVTPGSPAALVGLRPQDVIVRVNGQPIREMDDLFLHIGLGLAGRESVIEFVRPNQLQPQAVTVTLAKADNPEFGEASQRPTPIHGLRVDYGSVLASRSELATFDAVVVRETIPDSPAAAKLSEEADIITEVNGVRVRTPAEFYREASKADAANQPVRLTLINPPRTVFLP